MKEAGAGCRWQAHLRCGLLLGSVLCNAGCGGGSSVTDPAPSEAVDQPIIVAAPINNGYRFDDFIHSRQPRLQNLYAQLPTPQTPARALIIDSDTASPAGHASQVISVLRAFSDASHVELYWCDIRSDSFANVRACLQAYAVEKPQVINYSRLLPGETTAPLDISLLPDDALLIFPAGQGNALGNVDSAVSGALLQSGRALLVSGENDMGTDLHPSAHPCGEGQERCLLAPYEVRSDDGPTLQGTSFSTPIVSGLAAMLRASWPALSATHTADLILGCVRQAEGLVETNLRTGRGLISQLDLPCVLRPAGTLRIQGLPDGAGLSGQLLSAGSFQLSTLTAHDDYGRNFAMQPGHQSVPGRNTFLQGFFDVAAQLHEQPQGWLQRGLISPAQGRLSWHTPFGQTRLIRQLHQQAGAEVLMSGAMQPLGAARLYAGATLERHAFAAGELIGTGQLRIGDSLGWFAGVLMPMQLGPWSLDLQVAALGARMLRAADRSAIRALSARMVGLGAGVRWQYRRGLQLGLRTHCHSGLGGRARLGSARLELLADSSCGATLQFSLTHL